MATRSNRSATAANKIGGDRKRRNWATRLFNTHKKLKDEENQKAFRANRHETVARMRNESTADVPEPFAPGVPEGRGYSPGRKRKWTHDQRLRADHVSQVFTLRCPALGPHNELPQSSSLSGGNISPRVQWSGMPSGTEELVLVCEGLDELVEGRPFVHWLVYRILVTTDAIPEGAADAKEIISDIVGTPLQGRNSGGGIGYFGPASTAGPNWRHYRFRLYALESPLRDLRPGMTREELLKRMEGPLLDVTETVGRFRE